MKRNTSNVVEMFYRTDGEPIEVHPRFCFEDGALRGRGMAHLPDGPPLAELIEKKNDLSICFWRTFALGDILVLTPIFNWLKEMYPACSIYFATVSLYLDLFKYWDAVRSVGKRHVFTIDYDVGYYLDGVVEKDHREDRFSYMHRLDINCEFLGIPVPKDPIFSLPYSEKEKLWAEKTIAEFASPNKPVMVMQVSGAMWFNSLPLPKVKAIAEGLSEVCSLILVHNSRGPLDLPNVLNLAGKTTVHELAAIIDSADVALTMDSGTLWVAHCTKTPIIAMFGHTRAEEKMAHHRNYHAIDLAKMVGCQSCFGRPAKCNGAADCLTRSDEKQIIKEIRDGIVKLVLS
jgi:ADP-heptose:LPS heptosyltransferase